MDDRIARDGHFCSISNKVCHFSARSGVTTGLSQVPIEFSIGSGSWTDPFFGFRHKKRVSCTFHSKKRISVLAIWIFKIRLSPALAQFTPSLIMETIRDCLFLIRFPLPRQCRPSILPAFFEFLIPATARRVPSSREARPGRPRNVRGCKRRIPEMRYLFSEYRFTWQHAAGFRWHASQMPFQWKLPYRESFWKRLADLLGRISEPWKMFDGNYWHPIRNGIGDLET